MKLAIVVGTRPEIIRLSATINLARELFEVSLIHTGQNYDYNLNETFFHDLNINRPDYYLNCSRENIGKAIGDIIDKSYNLFREIKPDALLILGDTNSCLCAYSAKRLKIPTFHLEAGNRCRDPNVPEEINRKIIDGLADVNICYMQQAYHNLIREGVKSEYTFVCGSPIPEIYQNIKDKITQSDILTKYGLSRNGYFVWSSHREENIDNETNFQNTIDSINNLADKYDNHKIVFSVHPRTRNKINSMDITFRDNIILVEPLGLIDYYCLQQNAACVISDSGTVTEESAILGFKAVLLRTSTEHPEGIDAGTIILGNNQWKYLEISISLVMEMTRSITVISDYQDTNFSEKVCKIVAGYTSVINKFIWNL